MAATIPIVPKVESVVVHTGNIVNWNRLKRKLTQSPREELAECLGSTIKGWLEGSDRDILQDAQSVQCCNEKFIEQLPASEREELKVTAKLCMCNMDTQGIHEALNEVMSELGISHLETVLLSMPEDRRTWNDIETLWRTLEGLREEEKIYTLGTADLDKPNLEHLYNKANWKPSVNQVNLASCCVMPADLTEFAKENDIQLLTHNDEPNLLPAEDFRAILAEQLTARDGEGWEPSWIVRYSVLIKCRGIIKTKGYVVKATRKLGLKAL